MTKLSAYVIWMTSTRAYKCLESTEANDDDDDSDNSSN